MLLAWLVSTQPTWPSPPGHSMSLPTIFHPVPLIYGLLAADDMQLGNQPPVFTRAYVRRANAIVEAARFANRDPRARIRHQRLRRARLAGIIAAIVVHAQVGGKSVFRLLRNAIFYICHVARGHLVLGMGNRLPRLGQAAIAPITAIHRDEINL